MSGFDALLVEDASGGMNRPVKGQEGYVCRAKTDLTDSNVEYVDETVVRGISLGVALADSNDSVDVDVGNVRRIAAAALTANRTYTLDDGNPTAGEILEIQRLDTTGFTAQIDNGGTGGGTLYTFPASEARTAVFRFDGTDWALEAHWKRA